MKIKPDSNCPTCRGSGEIYDSVPYGSTNALMESFCDCVEYQIPDDYDGDIELDYGTISDEFTNLRESLLKLFGNMRDYIMNSNR